MLGIIAVCASFLLLGGALGLIGLILGFVHLRKSPVSKTMAWWGVGLSALSLLASIGFGVVYFKTFKHLQAALTTAGESDSITKWEGVIAPDLTFTTLDGNKITLSDLRGKRVVLDFWATWCPPCRKEIPHFIHLVSQTSTNDLVVIGISSENEKTLRTFIKENGMNYPVASSGKLPAPYDSIESIPTTLFIDRHGVIQNIYVGYHDFEDLQSHATQKDWEGTPKSKPTEPESGLKTNAHPLQAVLAWSTPIPGASALCAGDWDADGSPEILVADLQHQLHVLSLAGAEKEKLSLPDGFTLIECGRHKDQGARLLGYSNWGRKVVVMDRHGKEIWSYGSLFGVDGAHWGDLDGDGTDELIVGMNGGGGLHAVTSDGKLLWKVSLGNVWNQAVIPARDGRPALIFATEASGSVKVFDAKGNLVRSFRPMGKYCAQLSAATIGENGGVQALAIGSATTMAFDQTGAVAWSTTAIENHGGWRNVCFASGDLKGDGGREWAFLEGSGDLVVATPQGEKLCAIPSQKGAEAFVIASAPGTKGVLVTLKSGALQAYQFEPSQPQTDSKQTVSAQ